MLKMFDRYLSSLFFLQISRPLIPFFIWSSAVEYFFVTVYKSLLWRYQCDRLMIPLVIALKFLSRVFYRVALPTYAGYNVLSWLINKFHDMNFWYSWIYEDVLGMFKDLLLLTNSFLLTLFFVS